MRINRPPMPSVGRSRDPLPNVLSTAGDRRDPFVRRQAREDPLDVLVDRRGQQRQRFGARLLGREGAGRPWSEASALWSSAVTVAELGEMVEHLLRIGPDPLQRELPAADGTGDEALGDAERGGERCGLVLVPAMKLGDTLEAVCDRKRSISSSGLMPGSSRR